MAQLPLDQINGFLRLEKYVVSRYNHSIAQAAERLGITKPEADVLLFLANNPQHNTARDVVRYRGFSKTYVSRAVEQLMARELVSAESSEADRRLQYLHPTARSSMAVCALRRAQADFFARLCEGVTAEEAAALERLFTRVEDNLRRL